MIKTLRVQNFALIEDVTIDFNEGLTALTGETGAGKSILLEAINLVFGARSDADMVRHGTKRAYVEATFLMKDGSITTINREVDISGRHVMKINGEIETLTNIKKLTNRIGSIHNQNDSLAILDKDLYLDFIDKVDEEKTDQLINQYLLSRSKYQTLHKKYLDLKNKKKESLEKQEFLEYQVNELKTLNLEKNEDEIITESLNKLKNHEMIKTALINSYELLAGENDALGSVYNAFTELEKVSNFDEQYLESQKSIESSYYELEEVKSRLYSFINNLDFDDKSYDEMQERSHTLSQIKRKYQKTIDELVSFLAEKEEELALINDYDGYLEEVKLSLDKEYTHTHAKGKELSEYRKKLAKKLATDMQSELAELDLPNADFAIEFTESGFGENGIDEVEFYISLNLGEPKKILSKVASGGERSRFLFAIKSLYAKYHELSLLVLDEIDIGISGKTAAIVATKMKEISKKRQVIVITHLPQVAAKSDYQFSIDKKRINERMTTLILPLSAEERVEKIALMLSGEKLSSFAIEQAKMLLSEQ